MSLLEAILLIQTGLFVFIGSALLVSLYIFVKNAKLQTKLTQEHLKQQDVFFKQMDNQLKEFDNKTFMTPNGPNFPSS